MADTEDLMPSELSGGMKKYKIMKPFAEELVLVQIFMAHQLFKLI